PWTNAPRLPVRQTIASVQPIAFPNLPWCHTSRDDFSGAHLSAPEFCPTRHLHIVFARSTPCSGSQSTETQSRQWQEQETGPPLVGTAFAWPTPGWYHFFGAIS